MKVYIAADHGGFELKNQIKGFLAMSGIFVTDLGPERYDTNDDYPDYALAVATKVLESPENRGILICRNGVGMDMVANKFRGIRAGMSWNPEHAASSRIHDDTNVLTLPADYLSRDAAIETVSAWLSTDFDDQERRQRRLDKMVDLGQKVN